MVLRSHGVHSVQFVLFQERMKKAISERIVFTPVHGARWVGGEYLGKQPARWKSEAHTLQILH